MQKNEKTVFVTVEELPRDPIQVYVRLLPSDCKSKTVTVQVAPNATQDPVSKFIAELHKARQRKPIRADVPARVRGQTVNR
jgi:ribosomal protein S17